MGSPVLSSLKDSQRLFLKGKVNVRNIFQYSSIKLLKLYEFNIISIKFYLGLL